MVSFLDKGEGDHVDVGGEDSPQLAPSPLYASCHCAVYANHLHPIARPEAIHVAVIGQQGH